MKLKKQFALIIAMLLLPLAASAAAVEIGGIYYNLNADTKQAEVTSNLNKYSGSVDIPNTVSYGGVTYNVTSIGYNAFSNCYRLTSVTIPNSVTSIGSSAFYGCEGLTSVTIPNSVTSIGSSAFYDCKGLTSVTIPNSVSSIGNSVFYGCKGLTFVTISNSVTSIGENAFYDCESLTSVTIPNTVASIGKWAFKECSGLTSVTIPNSVTSIGGYAFANCKGLTSIVVESGNTVYDSRGNCNAIIKTDTNELVAGCKNTVIPNSVTSIGDVAFSGCDGLTSVTIPNSVTSIGYGAFSGCSGLPSVTIPNSVTSIGDNAFAGCSSLTSVTIPNSVTSIGRSAFSECSGLTSVTIPNSVTSIGEGAFGRSGLTSVIIPNSVTSIETYTFSGCDGLISVTIPNSVTSIGWGAFYQCGNLTSVTIPNSVTSIESLAFKDTGWHANQPDGLLYLDNWLLGYKGTEPSGELVIKEGSRGIAGGAVSYCSGLTSVTIPNSVTSIGSTAFYKCSGLTSIAIPNSVTSIGSSTFSGTGWYNNQPDGLLYLDNWLLGYKGTKPSGELVIKEGTKGIAGSAFSSCLSLTSVSIPNSMTSLGEAAFSGCSALNEVHSQIAPPFAINANVFEKIRYNATLYVPSGTEQLYRAAEGWNAFRNYAIEHVAVTGLTINKTKMSLPIGSTAKLKATVLPENAANKDVTWSTSDNTVVAVEDDGTVKGIKEGVATVTCASVEDPSILAQCTIAVKDGAIEGDLNGDDEIDVTDVVELIDMVLAGIYDKVGDINGDGEVDVTDVVELIDMVLSGE